MHGFSSQKRDSADGAITKVNNQPKHEDKKSGKKITIQSVHG